jgi:hypothetical protein
MIWAVLALSLASLGFAGTAVALAVRSGKLKSDRDGFELELGGALKGLQLSQDRVEELAKALAGRGKELQSLRDELETCGDPSARARLAVDGIARLLSAPEADQDADLDHS